jgi:fructose-1,6-bisphosphatase/sedoheptulose 1,7-bisphosphatase-like protein
VGQLALGDITNVDIFVILDATEKALETLDVTTEEREEARTVIRRMRDAGATVATSAVTNVLRAAVQQALGLPG